MTAFRKYRHLVAAFLLAIYAFGATPTQLWHHHAQPVYGKADSESLVFKSTVDRSGVSSHDCFACAHKYSVYDDAVFIGNVEYDVSFPDKHLVDHVSIPSSPSFGLSNKGPPQFS